MSSRSSERRGFLKGVFGALAAAIAAVVGVPITVAFLDPSHRRTVTGGGGPRAFGKLADLPLGVPQRRDVVSGRQDAWDRSDPKPVGAIWLLRRDQSRVDAYSAVCPHLGCAIGYDGEKRAFTCPCHDSAFALDDGRRLKGPAPRGLDPLPVEIHEGKVLVTYEQFIQGIPAREKA
jgi:menaquinol-cytochrome c reductase iron-sulfur subunit